MGKPIVGVDLGGGRAWSAAVAVWGNGRVEARAVAPGIPDLDEQERRDRVPPGTYAKLYDMGQLEISGGPESTAAGGLVGHDKGGLVVLDRFRLAEFEDATGNKVRLRAGRGPVGKTAVVGMKDRDTGQITSEVVEATDAPTLQGFVERNTEADAMVYTDDARAYRGMHRTHEAVKHSVSEYVRGMAHTNGIGVPLGQPEARL